VIEQITFNKNNKRGASRRVTRNKTPNLLNGTDKTITLSGKYLINQTLGTTVADLGLNPKNFGTRLSTYTGLFQEFRFRRITIKMHPATTSGGARSDYVVSYSKALTTTAPASLVDAYQLPCSRLSAQTDTVPQTFKIDMATLRNGPRVWYNCDSPSGTESQDQVQGFLNFIGTLAASSAELEIGYEIQFRGQTTPADS